MIANQIATEIEVVIVTGIETTNEVRIGIEIVNVVRVMKKDAVNVVKK